MIRTNKYIFNAPENTTFNGEVNVRYTPHDMELYSRQKEKLTFPKYKWWYDAIVNDDLPTIKHHLQTSSTKEKNLLLNGRFESFKDLDDDLDDTDDFGYDCLRELNAFSLATAYLASEETLLELLSHGVDLSLQNTQGKNCVHIMITLALLKPETEDNMMNVYSLIQDHAPADVLKTVLFQEDEDGIRPLELASNYTTCGLFQSIFTTRGVYLTKEVTRNLCTKQYIDITDYESVDGERYWKSPMIFFSMLDKRAVHSKHIDSLFNSEYFNEWVTKRYRKLISFILLWLFLKILLFFAYLAFDGAFLRFEERQSGFIKSNETSCLDQFTYVSSTTDPFTFICIVYIVISCISGLLIDGHEIILAHQKWHKNHIPVYLETIKGTKKFLYDYGGHRINQFLISIGILAHVITRLLRYEFDFKLSQLVSGLWYFLIVSQMVNVMVFFLQAIPRMGFYAVILQRMSSLFMWHFVSIFVIVATPYIIAIHRLINFGQVICQDNFDSMYHTIYSTFLLTFNILDFNNIEGSNEYLIVMYIIHIVFVLLIGVLLLNFLVALFTNYVASVLEIKHIVIPVHLLFVLGIVERRIKTYFKWIIKRHLLKFFTSDGRGRIYVCRRVVASRNKLHLKRHGNGTAMDNHAFDRNFSNVSEEHNFFDNSLNIQRRNDGRVRKFSALNGYQTTML